MASPATDTSESVRRCGDRSGEPSRSGDPDREPLRVAEGESTTESPKDAFVRSGETGKTGMLGDMASFEGEGGREGGSIFWMGDSLRRASMTVAMWVDLLESVRDRCMQYVQAAAVSPSVFTKLSKGSRSQQT